MNRQNPRATSTQNTTRLDSATSEDVVSSSASGFQQAAPGVSAPPQAKTNAVYSASGAEQVYTSRQESFRSISASSSTAHESAQKRARYSLSGATQRVLERQYNQQKLLDDSTAMPPPPPPNVAHQSTRQPLQRSQVPSHQGHCVTSRYYDPQVHHNYLPPTQWPNLNYHGMTTTIPSPPQSPGPDISRNYLSFHPPLAPVYMNTPIYPPLPPHVLPPVPAPPAPMSWNECLSLPLGRLPRSADCYLHNKHLLAQIPFRTMDSRAPDFMYRHFFLTLTPHVDPNKVKWQLDNYQDLEEQGHGDGYYDPWGNPSHQPHLPEPQRDEGALYVIMCFHLENDGSICGQTMSDDSTEKNDHCMREHAATWQALSEFRSEQIRYQKSQGVVRQGVQPTNSTPGQLSNPSGLTIFSLIPGFLELKDPPKSRSPLALRTQMVATVSLHLAVSSMTLTSVQSRFIPEICACFGYDVKAPSTKEIQDALKAIFSLTRLHLKIKLANDVLRGCYNCDVWTQHGCHYDGITFRYLDWDFRPHVVALGLNKSAQSNEKTASKFLDERLRSWGLHDKAFPGAADSGVVTEAMEEASEDEDESESKTSWIFFPAHKMQKCIEQAMRKSPDAFALFSKMEMLSEILHASDGAEYLRNAQKDLGLEVLCSLGLEESRWSTSFLAAVRCLELEQSISHLAKILKAEETDVGRTCFWKCTSPMFLNTAQFEVGRQIINILHPAFEFISSMSEHGPAVSRVYPKIKEILDDATLPLAPEAIELRAALRAELEATFPLDDIPDETLMVTFLDPANVGGPLLEMVSNGVKMKDRAARLLKDAQRKLLGQKVPLYTNRQGTDFGARYTLEAIQRHLGYDLLEYNHLAHQDNARNHKVEDWWRDNEKSLLFLAPLARIYLSVQAFPAGNEPLAVVAGSMITEKQRPLGDPVLACMVLMKAWFNNFVKPTLPERESIWDEE
ncbi:hypothetical protein EMPS_10302 [Entomortierella parvispora]|uniref:Uncharacterized protein n=1 Tax=Entomortierella parvispora TaxID=205924 RepID=A0A9P3HKA0_9FUNG|nr:hypothetical protein EMPS_10302 [Entomortierella parvispora]